MDREREADQWWIERGRQTKYGQIEGGRQRMDRERRQTKDELREGGRQSMDREREADNGWIE